jgi:hypothetical protein
MKLSLTPVFLFLFFYLLLFQGTQLTSLKTCCCAGYLHCTIGSTQQEETIGNAQVGLATCCCCTGVAHGHGCPFQGANHGRSWPDFGWRRGDGWISRHSDAQLARALSILHPPIHRPSGIARAAAAGDDADRRPATGREGHHALQEHVWSWWPVFGLLLVWWTTSPNSGAGRIFAPADCLPGHNTLMPVDAWGRAALRLASSVTVHWPASLWLLDDWFGWWIVSCLAHLWSQSENMMKWWLCNKVQYTITNQSRPCKLVQLSETSSICFSSQELCASLQLFCLSSPTNFRTLVTIPS